MSIFGNIFGGGNSAPTQPQQQAPVATPAPTPAPTASPIDTYKDLWQPSSTQSQPDPTKPGNIFAGADLGKMREAAKGVDFSRAVNQELFAKATGGNAEQADALMQLINGVAQTAYAHATFAATKITDQGLSKFNEGLDSRLPSTIKRFNTAESLAASNPELQHPAVAPLVSALQMQFTQKFPNASAAEIASHTTEYLQHVFGLVKGKTPTEVKPAAGEDWAKFFDPPQLTQGN